MLILLRNILILGSSNFTGQVDILIKRKSENINEKWEIQSRPNLKTMECSKSILGTNVKFTIKTAPNVYVREEKGNIFIQFNGIKSGIIYAAVSGQNFDAFGEISFLDETPDQAPSSPTLVVEEFDIISLLKFDHGFSPRIQEKL